MGNDKRYIEEMKKHLKNRIEKEKKEEDKNRDKAINYAIVAGRYIKDTYGADEVYVFGSYIWGIPDDASDLDIAISNYDKSKADTIWALGTQTNKVFNSYELDIRDFDSLSTALIKRIRRYGIKVV